MHANSCQFRVVIVGNGQLCSVLLEVRQQAAIDHVGHHDVGGTPHIYAHSNQLHDVEVAELGHFEALLNHAVEIVDIEHTCIVYITFINIHLAVWLAGIIQSIYKPSAYPLCENNKLSCDDNNQETMKHKGLNITS